MRRRPTLDRDAGPPLPLVQPDWPFGALVLFEDSP